MEQQFFSDGIGQITIMGGAIRLDFITFSSTEKDPKGQPAAVFSHRVVMSLEGFMQSAAKLQEAALAVSKLLQRARESQPPESVSASAPQPAPAAAGVAAAVGETATQVAPMKRPFP
jgi:hypothetical protein